MADDRGAAPRPGFADAVIGRFFRAVFSAPLAVFALGLVAIRPLFASGRQLVCSDDVAFHLLRLTQLDHLMRQGVFYSRWAPDMANGYGFPLFNFYAPLSYYFAEAVSLLVGGDLNLGLRLTFAFGIIAGGLTMYRLARDSFGALASMVAAVAFMYAPYQGYDVYFRGNLAESFVLWLLPLSLWCMGRLVKSQSWGWVLPTTLSYAAVLLTHNVFGLIFSPLLLAFGIWQSLQNRKDDQVKADHWMRRLPPAPRSLLLPLAAITFGLAITAFFWGPALLERSFVHIDRLLVPGIFGYADNFVTLRELFTLPRAVRSDLINPSIPRALGLPQVLLAACGLGAGMRWSVVGGSVVGGSVDDNRPLTLFFGLASIVIMVLTLPVSTPVWATVPLLAFVQFPWRLLGVGAVTLAWLCGRAVEWVVENGQWLVSRDQSDDVLSTDLLTADYRIPLIAVLITVIVLSAQFWLDPRYCPGNSEPTVTSIASYERVTGTVGTTAKGEYLPLTADFVPDDPADDPFSVPDGVSLANAVRTPLTFKVEAQSAEPFLLTANVFDYPGWRATIDGRPADTSPSPGAGLITLDVLAGQHEVVVEFGQTPFRKAMNRLSATALILLIGLTVFTQSTQKRRLQPATFNLQPVHLQPSHISLATLGLILFILVGWGLPSLRVSGLEQLEAQGRQAGYENGLVLLDYTIEAREMPADEQMPILLVLKTDRPLDADMQTLIRLIDTDGNVWTTKDALKPRIYRQYYGSRAWLVDQYAEDMLLVDPIPGTPPGLYRLELVIFDKDSLAPAVLTSGESGFNLGTVQLTRPNGAESITIQQTADGRFGPVSLIGYALDRAEANSGDPFKMTLSWRSDQVTNDDLVADIQLLDPAGNVAFSRAISPVRGDWPTSRWQAGDRWLGQHPFRLPAALTSGEHQWRVCIQADCEMVGSLAVTAPDRTFDRPEAVDQTFDAQFGDVAKLIGLNQTFNDGVQEFTLFWEPTAETETSYRVFVQLLGPDGSVRAQSDQEPARWTRPTTGWAVGEVVADQHALRIPDLLLPTGTYMIIVGLYDPGTGDRLVLPNGESFVEIQRIKSVE